jgi:hypothetical protein
MKMQKENIQKILKRAAHGIQVEERAAKQLVILQDAHRIDLQALNELQLRVKARELAIQALQAITQKETTNGIGYSE